MSEGANPSRALILWQPPQQIIMAALSTASSAVNLNLQPTVECPLDKLNTKIMLKYLYADLTPVQVASFVLETVPGTPVMGGQLQNGEITLTVPKGSYCYYFHHDGLTNGNLFEFFPQALVQLGPAVVPVPQWPSDVTAQGTAKKLRMHWGSADFHLSPDDNAVPVLEKLIYYVVTKVMPAPGQDALQIEATWLIEALILGGGSADLWRRLVFNRLGVALGGQSLAGRSRVLQQLLQFLYATANAPASVVLQAALGGMNHAGKGNAVDWLRALSRLSNDIESMVAGHILKLFTTLDAELGQISSASPDQAWAHNTTRAMQGRTNLGQLPAPFTKVSDVLDGVWRALGATVAAHPAITYHLPGQVEQWNVLRQSAFPFRPYQPAPVVLPVTWFEVQYLYADGTPVEQANFVVWNQTDAQIARFLGRNPLRANIVL